MKRSHGATRSLGGGSDGTKVDRQALFDELKKYAASGQSFTAVDVALSIGAGEPQVAKMLLGLAVEHSIEKAEPGRYKATPMADVGQADFLRAFSRAGKVDTTRMGDLREIERLKQNNDTMRQRLLAAQAERDHYLAALKKHGIDAGPPPAVVAAPSESSTAAPESAPEAAPPVASSEPSASPQHGT